MNSPTLHLDPHVETLIDAFEEAVHNDASTNVFDFLPDRDDPKFAQIATELIRIDLELAWGSGAEKSLDDYGALFAELKQHDERFVEAAYEEFRQRNFHGQTISVDAFSEKYEIAPEDWSTVIESHDERTMADANFDDMASKVPAAGDVWREFEILREIGRGAMSRVLLARQTSLSGRRVVLKFAPKHLLEADKLAKLQHANIVPVFSVYEDSDFHIFCMPYLGSETLEDEFNTNGDDGKEIKFASEADGTQILTQLAHAIEHAHQRGILHNDLKPANVLWSNGHPMLLDFNLAADASEVDETIGGTLPYMSPEAIQGLLNRKRNADQRSDIYSLGAMVYELVSGKPPFGKEVNRDKAIALRQNPSRLATAAKVSPSFAAIIDKCLAPEPADRYQSASELVTDLDCHTNHRPLKYAGNRSWVERVQKWSRRHPRLTSVSTLSAVVCALAIATAVAWSAREKYVNRLEAAATFTEFNADVDRTLPKLLSTRLDIVDSKQTVADAQELLSTYVSDGTDWKDTSAYLNLSLEDRLIADQKIAKLALTTSITGTKTESIDLDSAERLLAIASSVQKTPTKSLLLHRVTLEIAAGKEQEAEATFEESEAMECTNADDLMLVGWFEAFSKPKQALKTLQQAVDLEPGDYDKWYTLSQAFSNVMQWSDAERCLTTCIALQNDSALARYRRALCRSEIGNHEQAIRDFSAYLEFSPDNPHALLNRAIAYKAAGNYEASLADLDAAIGQGFNSTRPLLIRSRVKKLLGDRKGSSADMTSALVATPQDDLGWVSRGVAKMARKPEAALQDFRKALELNPRSHSARRNIAYVLSEKLDKTEEAIACLDKLVADYPLDDGSFGGRGVLLARVGRLDEAIEDAKTVVTLQGGAMSMLQAACVYAIASENRPKLRTNAVTLLGHSFRLQPDLAKLATGDMDLKQIHDDVAFKDLCAAAKYLSAVPSAESAVGAIED